jgi:hypothetical protein
MREPGSGNGELPIRHELPGQILGPADPFGPPGQGRQGGGVVKGGTGPDDLWMCKIKTLANLERLMQTFAKRWQDYWE